MKVLNFNPILLSYKFIPQAIPEVAGLLVIAVGGLVLLGWGVDIALIRQFLPSLASMKANTALCFGLAGLALWIRGQEQREVDWTKHYGQLARLLRQICTIGVLTVGFLTLSEYMWDWDLGIDQLLAQDWSVTQYSGRMGESVAFCFVLVGIAFGFLGHTAHWGTQVAQLLTIGIVLPCMLALVGYTYNIEVFYTLITRSTNLDLHTALTFLILCMGILATHPEKGLMHVFTSPLSGGMIARSLLPSTIILPLCLGWAILQGQQQGLW
jgi:hypothetical protein